MKQKLFNGFFVDENKVIKDFVRKNKLTVYGARAIKAQAGLHGRPTQDYDIYSKIPRNHAKKLERRLDKVANQNLYFTKPAVHRGTWKVRHIGADRRANTRDDLEVADFSRPTRKMRTVRINGISYVHYKETLQDKRNSLRDTQYKFRWSKDRDDIMRIREAVRARKFRRII